MIIGVEALDNYLMISYYDADGKIAYIKKPLYDHEIFNWVEHNKPSVYKNWDGTNIKSEPSDPKWLTRSRLEELIFEKLTKSERELIYNFDNLPNISYTDIEILLTNDDFPSPEKAEMPVGMISFCNEDGISYVLSIMKSDEYPNGLLDTDINKMEQDVNDYFHNTVPHDDKDKIILMQNFKIKHKFFETEKDLMEFYFHNILPKKSFITGWNFTDFDWQYLMNRGSRIGIDTLAGLSSRRTFSKKHNFPMHVGILDYMQLFIDPGYRPYKVVEDYTLNYISSRALNTSKLSHPYKSFMEFQKDVYMFTMYNIIDNILVKLIEDKFGLMDVAFSVANVAEIEVNKVFSPVHITEVLMCRQFLQNGNKKMLKKKWNNEVNDINLTYEGAYVMPPVPGYYKYVSCYDVKSMYPNIQMQFNCSPDTYLGKIGMVKINGTEIITKNNTLFDSQNDSVARIILERLYNARVDAQDEIKHLKFNT